MGRTNPLIKPFLKWAGGKRQLLPEIRKHIPSHFTTYFEPFLGAGAVFLDLQPKQAVINDFNEQLMLTYEVIRDNVEDLIEALRKHQSQNSQDYYYDVRGFDRRSEFEGFSKVDKAARLIYLNKTCYNGLYRVNAQGLFNVPYGRYKNPAICEDLTLRAVSTYLRSGKITILRGNFAKAVATARKGAFVYFDPPYHSPDSTNFTGYQADAFGEAQQKELRDVFVELTERGVKCLLSNSDTEFIKDLYRDKRFKISRVQAARAINADATGRGKVNEVLVQNW